MTGLLFIRVAPPLGTSHKRRAIFACPYCGTEVGLVPLGLTQHQPASWKCWICMVPWGVPGREEIAAIIGGGG